MEQKCNNFLRFPLSWSREWSKSRIFCRKVHFLMHSWWPGVRNGAKMSAIFKRIMMARSKEWSSCFCWKVHLLMHFLSPGIGNGAKIRVFENTLAGKGVGGYRKIFFQRRKVRVSCVFRLVFVYVQWRILRAKFADAKKNWKKGPGKSNFSDFRTLGILLG